MTREPVASDVERLETVCRRPAAVSALADEVGVPALLGAVVQCAVGLGDLAPKQRVRMAEALRTGLQTLVGRAGRSHDVLREIAALVGSDDDGRLLVGVVLEFVLEDDAWPRGFVEDLLEVLPPDRVTPTPGTLGAFLAPPPEPEPWPRAAAQRLLERLDG